MKLLRPYIPIPVRIAVVQRQLLRFDVAAPDREKGERQDVYLDRLLGLLSTVMDALFEPLHLDHDPALTNRRKIFRNGVHVGYSPAANNPDYLVYRTKAQHDIKTRVRGEGAQYSDLALARKNKRIEKRRAKNDNAKGAVRKKGRDRQHGRSFPRGRGFPKARLERRKSNRWPIPSRRNIRSENDSRTPPHRE